MQASRTMLRLCSALLLSLTSVLTPQPANAQEPFLGEIRWVAFSFAPRNWALCNGQLLPINQNQALFALLGTTFGGDGVVNFALPDLRSRAPIHVGNGRTLGSKMGAETHTLTQAEMPSHSHTLRADPREGTAAAPAASGFLAKTSSGTSAYGSTPSAGAALAASAVGTTDGSQPHENMKPFITLNCIIALTGIFPPQN